MGTRHLVCVFYKGRFVVAQYGQWDGMPDGQGLTLMRFLRTPWKIQRLKDGLNHIYQPSDSEVHEAKDRVDKLMRLNPDIWLAFVESPSAHSLAQLPAGLLPSLSRDTGAGILEVISQAKIGYEVPIDLNLPFANDSLYCEWVYVVDLDQGILEIFCGAEEKRPHHRFEGIGGDESTVPALICSYDFSELEDISEPDFLSRVRDTQNRVALEDMDSSEDSENDEAPGTPDHDPESEGPVEYSLIKDLVGGEDEYFDQIEESSEVDSSDTYDDMPPLEGEDGAEPAPEGRMPDTIPLLGGNTSGEARDNQMTSAT